MRYVSPKFKVGDKVRVLDVKEIGMSYDLTEGNVYPVVGLECESDGYVRDAIVVRDDCGSRFSITDNEFHAIEKLTGGDRMFKIGDELRITGTSGNCATEAKVGGKAVVLGEFDGKHYRVNYENTISEGMSMGWIAPNNLEIAPKYRTVKRKAHVGERILITNAGFSLGHYKNGDVLTVVRTGVLGEYAVELEGIQGGNFHIGEKEYEVIIEEPTQQSRKRVDALEAEIEALKERIATLEKADKPTVNASQPKRSRDFADALSEVGRIMANTTRKSPNQQRKATIERAKAFVEDVKERALNFIMNDDGNHIFNRKRNKLTFHVNVEKRVVTALAHSTFDGKLLGKAFAKCASGDVFNADIGMAIAAGRLYGLDVSEFVNAVQPTEFAVGQVTRTKYGAFYTITKISGNRAKTCPGTYHRSDEFGKVAVTDDTEAQY